MRFSILAHACMQVEADGKSLVCDPWLSGSAYWGSWWNYPPVSKHIFERLNPDFIFITHLHWDHFHGPTLRRLGLDRTILIPKAPGTRLRDDLLEMGFKKVIELPHGTTLKLGNRFQITSYQFGFLPDCLLVIDADGTTLMNANDTKIMGGPLRKILKNHRKIDFVFRSHSSANSRVCYEIIDRGGLHQDDQSRYSREFAEFVEATGARYCVPFASNHCFLHPETLRFNSIINFSYSVKKYFDENGIVKPECVVMAPGDSWDDLTGFQLGRSDWYTRFDEKVSEYARDNQTSLDAAARKEAEARLNVELLSSYVANLSAATPSLIRRVFKDKPITLVCQSGDHTEAFELNLYSGQVKVVEAVDDARNPIQIITSSLIIQQCIERRNWESLGISKRVRYRVAQRNVKVIRLFQYVYLLYEIGALPVLKNMNARFAGVWARRWREILFMLRLGFDFGLGRGFVYRRYLNVNRFSGPGVQSDEPIRPEMAAGLKSSS